MEASQIIDQKSDGGRILVDESLVMGQRGLKVKVASTLIAD